MNELILKEFDDEDIRRLQKQLVELDGVKLEDICGENFKVIAEHYIKEKLAEQLGSEIKKAKFDLGKYKDLWLRTLNSEITKRNYRHSVDEFFEWSGNKSPFDMTSLDMDLYIVYLRSKKYSEGSVRFKVAGVSSFFSFLVRHEILSRNCCEKLKLPRRRIENKCFDDVPTVEELEVIEKELNDSLHAKGKGSTIKIKGSRTLLGAIIFIKETGCRIGALPSVRLDVIGNFIAKSKGADIRGKISLDTMCVINELGFDKFAPFKDIKVPTVKKYFEIVCRRLFVQGKIRKVFSPHSVRHFAAVKHWNENHDIYALKKFLNHKSIATSQVYLASLNMEV